MKLFRAMHPAWNFAYFVVGCGTVVGMTFAMAEHIDGEEWTMVLSAVVLGVREVIGVAINQRAKQKAVEAKNMAYKGGDFETERFISREFGD